MKKAIYIAALAVIAWLLFSGKKSVATIPASTGSATGTRTILPPFEPVLQLKNGTISLPATPPVIEPVNPNPATVPVVQPPIATEPVILKSATVPVIQPVNPNPGATPPVVVNVPSIYTPPAPGELVKVKPYNGTEVYGTYSEGNATRPVSEYYQKMMNDKVLIAMYTIFENFNNPSYKLVDAVNESLATNKPVWLVVLMHARATAETGKLEEIGHYENGTNGVFGSISRSFTANLPENVLIANANIYLTRQTNGLYLKAMYSPENNGNPFWRVVYNMAKAIAIAN